MKKYLPIFFSCIVLQLFAQQTIRLEQAKFKQGDNTTWKELNVADTAWAKINTGSTWEQQGYADYDGFAWYRFHFFLPAAMKQKSLWKDSLRVYLNKVDDNEETYINGNLIGKTEGWNIVREYHIAANSPFLKWDGENVLAVRVFDGGGGGGMYGGPVFISMMDLIDGISLKFVSSAKEGNILIQNAISKKVAGSIQAKVVDPETNKTITTLHQAITLNAGSDYVLPVIQNLRKKLVVIASFTESKSGKSIKITNTTPYILTPPTALTPRINGASVFGVRPGAPIQYKIAATGSKPLQYGAERLPKELALDPTTGIISGKLDQPGDYRIKLLVTNSKGKAERIFTIKVGNLLALTPPMGWNSWNCWGLSVSAAKVKSSAQALIDKGLIDHGWSYINIDDGWESETRNADGSIVANDKFPDMKGLGDWLHNKGLKFGIYSSPGTRTCGGYLGSYTHEINDATTYAQWGIDYLKYDWCSYRSIAKKDTSLAIHQKPYAIMRDALLKQNRDMVYSLCQYGMKNVWEWGDQVNGNCWRTTDDINDSWESLRSIGFSQTIQHNYTKPGRWSDPDMLVVGQLGWGENLHETKLNPDEQYTHISLWSLLAAPLLIGCDISKMDDFTVSLLSNDEVIAVNQDALGKEAKQVIANKLYQVWMKPLEDGTYAIGLFNLSNQYQQIRIKWSDIGLNSTTMKVHDLWQQIDLGSFTNSFNSKVAPHGVTFIKVKP